ncbi:hypothetical protein ALI44B_04575 [Leifsonia sp. ALI-44-B]|uniref:hypothetical protein n=1 Tax=Leifsonia sp. ALI-44-B TaxID=1933776 RepID=UPI00097C1E70|nr:hypothetical protein [Leifsonia sp. ALI-44-B]ONI63905.1 hypothetical protein ALI44B_04575 [Leifsonia sp. ALI-44-B]
MRISVFNSKELQGVILAMKGFERDLAKQIRRVTKSVVDPEWRKAVAERASTRSEARVLGSTARVAVSDQNVTLKSAAVGRALTGGLKPSENFAGVEFGADQNDVTTYQATSKKGKRFKVTRHTKRQFRPRKKNGYVVMPAAAEIIPRIASLWVQTTIRTFHELIEKR